MADRNWLAAIAGAMTGAAASRVDVALVAGSLATAAGAVAFAGYMTMSGVQGPLVNGMQYLAIFAQPNRGAHVGPAGVDMSAVGAIPHDLIDHVGGYALVGAQERYAWLREGNRIFAVRPGDDVPRLGRVAAIAERDGRWVLVDDKGVTLIAGAIVDLAPASSRRFGKRMIFSADR